MTDIQQASEPRSVERSRHRWAHWVVWPIAGLLAGVASGVALSEGMVFGSTVPDVNASTIATVILLWGIGLFYPGLILIPYYAVLGVLGGILSAGSWAALHVGRKGTTVARALLGGLASVILVGLILIGASHYCAIICDPVQFTWLDGSIIGSSVAVSLCANLFLVRRGTSSKAKPVRLDTKDDQPRRSSTASPS